MLDSFVRSHGKLLGCCVCAVALYASGCGGDSKGRSANGAGGSGGSAGAGGSAGGSGGTSGIASGGTGGGASGGAGGGASGGAGGSVAGMGGAGGSAGGTGGTGGDAEGGEAGLGGAAGAGGQGGQANAFESCAAILEQAPSSESAVYAIDPPGNPGDPIEVVCDMASDGGGWTLAFLKNSLGDGDYSDFASSYANTTALATTPEAASALGTTAALAGWLDLNVFPYSELKLAGYLEGTASYTSSAVPRESLRLAFGQNGYFLYGEGGYYWCGGDNAYTTDGTGQENQPEGAPDDCKGHTSLGNGWDFSETEAPNTGLTICGGGSALMTAYPASGFINYGNAGAAQAIWVR